MRYPLIIGLVLLGLLLLVWGRNLQAPKHVSDRVYDLVLSTLLSHNIPAVSVDQIASGEFHLLDARSSREFDVSHMPGAIWVGDEDFSLDRLTGMAKHTPIAVYCSVGYRSERIAEYLRQHGYTNVVNVYGGIFEWVNTGHPVVTPAGDVTETVHAYSKLWGVWLTRGARIY
jgi:rhodanese-related sulfurtransferase